MRPKTKIFLTISVLEILLSGCASYKELKEMTVDKRYEAKGITAKVLSACVEDLLKENQSGAIYSRNFDKIRGQWFVMSEFRTLLGSGNGVYNYSVSFKDIEKKVAIELRSIEDIWGRLQAPDEAIDQYVDLCAKP